jgi:N-acetyl-alpha-D-muramate 1-phosphate uridylyltransferase
MKAMILAAGRGERMRPLTDSRPKSLLEVRGKALIVRLVETLVGAGLRDLVINHAHLGRMIETALGNGARFGARIRYSPEAEALETAGGIAKALPLLGDGAFIAVNGDIFCDFDFGVLARRAPGERLAHLILVANPPHHPRGDFALDGAEVGTSGDRMWTFSGIGLYRPELFAGVAPGTKAQLAPLLRAAMAQKQVTGEVHRGIWHDVGTPERLSALNGPGA